MAKTNYSFEKRRRELAKKKKKEEKIQRKMAKNAPDAATTDSSPNAPTPVDAGKPAGTT